MPTLCIIGLGYIGLPTAVIFATHGFKVIGVDLNKSIVDKINRVYYNQAKQKNMHVYDLLLAMQNEMRQ